jgi:hypothetical protein
VERDDFAPFEELLAVLSKPYEEQPAFVPYADPPERVRQAVRRAFADVARVPPGCGHETGVGSGNHPPGERWIVDNSHVALKGRPACSWRATPGKRLDGGGSWRFLSLRD